MDEIWDYMIESGVFTQAELELVTCLNGYTRETLLDAWFVRTGEREIEQCE